MTTPRTTSTHDAVAQIAERYRAPLVSFFQRRVGNRTEAEDLTQEVLLRIASRADAAALGAAFIFTIAANLLRDRSRRLGARPGSVISLDALNGRIHPEAKDGLVEEISPERVLLGKETLFQVRQALNGLSPQTRDLFLLFRLEGMKQREIADLYGISVSAVEKHIVKALKHLAEGLR